MVGPYSGSPISKIASWELDERVHVKLLRTGFDTLQGLSNDCRVKFGVIGALARSYDCETHAFTFGQGGDPFTMICGLEDILYITGLPIDGKPVSGVDPVDASVLCREKLGQSENIGEKGFIKLAWLKDNYMRVDPTVSEDSLEFKYYVRAYVMYVIGCIIAPTGLSTVPVMYLNLLEDIDRIGEYAWGAALLASIYSSLNAYIKGKRTSEVIGCVYLLMVFAFKRFPFLLEGVDGAPTVEEFPLMVSWSNSLKKETRQNYHLRDENAVYAQFNDLTSESVNWQPYDINLLPGHLARQVVLGKSRTILFCFEKAMYHRPDLCPRQFGLPGPVVHYARPLQVINSKNRNGRKEKGGTNWLTKYGNFIGEWELRWSLLPVDDGANQIGWREEEPEYEACDDEQSESEQDTSSMYSEQSQGQATGMREEEAEYEARDDEQSNSERDTSSMSGEKCEGEPHQIFDDTGQREEEAEHEARDDEQSEIEQESDDKKLKAATISHTEQQRASKRVRFDHDNKIRVYSFDSVANEYVLEYTKKFVPIFGVNV